MSQAVVGIVFSAPQVDLIVDHLRASGFTNGDISLLMPESVESCELGYEKHTKAPEGISTGAGLGALFGGTLGWLAGAGSLVVPGAGAFVAAGPVMGALSGAAAAGAVGGIAGGLIGMGLPEYEAKQYESKVKDGSILLSVHTQNHEELECAERIFKNALASDVYPVEETKI